MCFSLFPKIESITGINKFWTHWQWYRGFFHIGVLRYLMVWFTLVPIFAKLLKKVPEEVTINTGVGSIALVMRLPFKWELLWASSFFFVVALMLYQMLCPRFVKRYASYADYKALMHSPRWIVWEAREIVKDQAELRKLVERLGTKRYISEITDLPSSVKTNPTENVVVEEKQTSLYFALENKKYRLSMPILTDNKEDKVATEIAEREIFWELFGRLSSSKSIIRLIILVLLALCFIYLTIVLIQNILTVLQYLLYK